MLRKIFVTTAALIVGVVSSFLVKTWAGFKYFSLAAFLVLAAYWFVEMLIDYLYTYKKEALMDRYNIYKACLVNSSAVTLEKLQEADAYYYKQFVKTLRKEKAIEWLKMLAVLGVALSCVVMFFN